jgi:hypothetical protein
VRCLLTVLLLLATAASASSLDRAALAAVLWRASPGFKRCYERALEGQPQLEGRARLHLEIAASGRVSAVTVDFPEDAPALTQCLREVAAGLHFSRGPAPYRLVWPIQFQRG